MANKKPLFKSLPDEIENYILELNGSMNHFEKMKQIKKQLEFQGMCNFLYHLPGFRWFETITDDECKKYMDLLSNCSCCKEHQQHRPTTKMMMDGFLPRYSEKPFLTNKKCKCKCRHLARDMCRERNDIEESEYMDDIILALSNPFYEP